MYIIVLLMYVLNLGKIEGGRPEIMNPKEKNKYLSFKQIRWFLKDVEQLIYFLSNAKKYQLI